MILKSDIVILERKGRAMPRTKLIEMVRTAPKGTISSASITTLSADVEFSNKCTKVEAQAIFNKNFYSGILIERKGRVLIIDVQVY